MNIDCSYFSFFLISPWKSSCDFLKFQILASIFAKKNKFSWKIKFQKNFPREREKPDVIIDKRILFYNCRSDFVK